jgi:hypothetical protein
MPPPPVRPVPPLATHPLIGELPLKLLKDRTAFPGLVRIRAARLELQLLDHHTRGYASLSAAATATNASRAARVGFAVDRRGVKLWDGRTFWPNKLDSGFPTALWFVGRRTTKATEEPSLRSTTPRCRPRLWPANRQIPKLTARDRPIGANIAALRKTIPLRSRLR